MRESLATSQEEADEIDFVPSAFSEPQEVYRWCDNRCSEKALRYMQIASMVIEEGGEAAQSICASIVAMKIVQQASSR